MSEENTGGEKPKPTATDLQAILDKPDDGKSKIVTAGDGSISVQPKDTTEWMLLHIKHGGGKVMGKVDVGEENSKRDATLVAKVLKKGQLLEVGNPHTVVVSIGAQMTFQTIPLSYGDLRIFIRTEEIAYAQFLGNDGMLVTRVRAQSSGIAMPGASGPASTSDIAQP